MGVEEKICHFYYEVVNQLQKDLKLSSLFLEQASTSMIFGREFGGSSLSSKEAYEIIFLLNLSYPMIKNYYNKGEMHEILKFLSSITNESFLDEVIEMDSFLFQKIYMMCRLTYDLENENDSSIALHLLKLKNKDYIETYKAFSELKNIIRTGWISRKVEENYRENDSVHSMQMFALAYVYFNLDKNISLDQKKYMK